MESILIPMTYYYKGSSNGYIRLEKDPDCELRCKFTRSCFCVYSWKNR